MKTLRQRCKNFVNKYIGWDGCTTIPVLFLVLVILIWMVGWIGFSVFTLAFIVIGVIQMYFDKKRMKGSTNE